MRIFFVVVVKIHTYIFLFEFFFCLNSCCTHTHYFDILNKCKKTQLIDWLIFSVFTFSFLLLLFLLFKITIHSKRTVIIYKWIEYCPSMHTIAVIYIKKKNNNKKPFGHAHFGMYDEFFPVKKWPQLNNIKNDQKKKRKTRIIIIKFDMVKGFFFCCCCSISMLLFKSFKTINQPEWLKIARKEKW